MNKERPARQDMLLSPALRFLGIDYPEETAEYLLLGVPYDGTSTFRPGSRFGPNAIREASRNLETLSLRTGVDLEDLKICDLGDLEVANSLEETLRRVEVVTRASREQGKIQITLGGEHSITLGTVRAWGSEVGVIDFDAHMDLRDEYMGCRLSHATFMRRMVEEIGGDRIIQVGVRAVCKEELAFAKKEEITFITSRDLYQTGIGSVAPRIREKASGFEKIFVTVDADVLDPSFAPAVGNPEPEGISTTQLIDLLHQTADQRTVGVDLVEVSPIYDRGVTAVQVCRVLFETISSIEYAKSHGRLS